MAEDLVGTMVCVEEGRKEMGTSPDPVGSLIKTTVLEHFLS